MAVLGSLLLILGGAAGIRFHSPADPATPSAELEAAADAVTRPATFAPGEIRLAASPADEAPRLSEPMPAGSWTAAPGAGQTALASDPDLATTSNYLPAARSASAAIQAAGDAAAPADAADHAAEPGKLDLAEDPVAIALTAGAEPVLGNPLRADEAEAVLTAGHTGSGAPPAAMAQRQPACRPAALAEPAASYPAAAESPPAGYGVPYTASPARVAAGTYVVGPNENYWQIAEKVYGTGNYFRALAEHNRKKHPRTDRLTIGDTIAVPTIEELEQDYADLCPRRTHSEAARRHVATVGLEGGAGARATPFRKAIRCSTLPSTSLKDPRRIAELIELNRDVLGGDYDYLTPGMRLRLPLTSQPSHTLTERPGQLLRSGWLH